MNRSERRATRRAVLGAGIGLGLGLAFVGTNGHAQPAASPGASPVAGMEYARPELLVDPAWLHGRQDAPSLLVVGLMPPETFTDRAILGAVQVDWPALEVTDTTDDSLAAWRSTTEALLTTLGLTRERTVVAYDEGTLFAARLWWVLRYLGHGRVHILNGGLPAWVAAGHEVTSGEPAPVAAEVPYVSEPQPMWLAQVPDVEQAVGDPGTVLVDARTPDEYAQGHIPGAVNVNYPLNAEPEPPRFLKPADALGRLYADAGVTPERRVIPYCTTGVRSAVTAFTLDLLGYPDVALFTGSWAEWSADPSRPVMTGDAP